MVGGRVDGRTEAVAGKVESLGHPDLKTGAYNGGLQGDGGEK